jgi:hypothetical protein
MPKQWVIISGKAHAIDRQFSTRNFLAERSIAALQGSRVRAFV